jgi:hypothetical protein
MYLYHQKKFSVECFDFQFYPDGTIFTRIGRNVRIKLSGPSANYTESIQREIIICLGYYLIDKTSI